MGLSEVRQARQTAGAGQASAVTVSPTLDFIDVAKVGDCLEFRSSSLKLGRALAFVD